MAIAAQLEETSQPSGRREPRLTLRMEALGATGAGITGVLVHNLSTTGLLLESALALVPGEKFAIDLPHAGTTRARVVWASGHLFGCEFHSPISAATLSAAQLRAPADDGATARIAPTRPVAPPASADLHSEESFGMRLQRLRKERGFTLAKIAQTLGVSKPTIWAWENGKTRPLDSRVEALAEMLGVPRAQLMGGADPEDRRDLLARSREQIAEAFGTSPQNVRIMIEL